MAEIKAFEALRYSEKQFPTPPVAPPYDIISEKRRQEIAADPKNIIHIDKPGPAGDEGRYDRAASLLQEWKKNGALITEDEAALYVYREEYSIPERPEAPRMVRTGFFACLKLVDFSEGVVLPHEKTLAAPKVDRMDLMKATKGNMSPIFGLYHDTSNTIVGVLDAAVTGTPIYHEYEDSDGTKHVLWKVTDSATIQQVSDTLKTSKVMIADGHHRYETALEYRNTYGAGNSKADYIMLCLVDFSDEGLVVLPTHRQVSVDIAADALVKKLAAYFSVVPVTADDMTAWVNRIDSDDLSLGLYVGDNTYYTLTLKDDCDYAALMPAEQTLAWKQLNVNILSYVVFKTVLALTEETFQKVVTYTHSFQEAIAQVDAKEVNCSFLLQGIDKFKVKEISENGELMPQKSTYFYPKLFTGFVMYEHA